jgi:sulfide:quinone oxidoreductase
MINIQLFSQISYEFLVLSLGISLDFKAIPGLLPALNKESNPVCSNYSSQTVEKTWRCIQKFSGGNAMSVSVILHALIVL